MNDRVLQELSILVVEDEYILAMEVRTILSNAGAVIIGPVGTIEGALSLIEDSPKIDGAILDTNLQGEMVFPVADRLLEEKIPFLFTTGYDASIIPKRFDNVARLGKPTNMPKLLQALSKMVSRAAGNEGPAASE